MGHEHDSRSPILASSRYRGKPVDRSAARRREG